MLANNHKFEEKLRKRFEEAEMAPPPNLWNKIDSQLQYAPPKKKTDYRSFYLGAAAALFLCVMSVGAFRLLEHKIEKTNNEQSQFTQKEKTTPRSLSPKISLPYNTKEVENATSHFAEKSTKQNENSAKQENKSAVLSSKHTLPPQHKGGVVENIANISVPPSLTSQNEGTFEHNNAQKEKVVLKKEEEKVSRGMNPIVLAIKTQLDAPKKTFSTENKATFASQLNEIEPLSIKMGLKSANNLPISKINAQIEFPVATKNKKFFPYISGGISQFVYNNSNKGGRDIWNRLGIESVSALNDSANVLSVGAPEEIGNLAAYNVKNVQISITNYDEYLGGGLEYKFSRFFGLLSGLHLHHQRTKQIELPLEYASEYQPEIFNTQDNWFRNKNNSFLSKNSTGVSSIVIESKDFFILEIPCMANFHLPIKRSQLTASLGTSYRKLLRSIKFPVEEKNTIPMLTNNSKMENSNVYRSNNGTLNIRVEYEYALSPQTSVFAAANAQWFANPLYSDSQSIKRLPKLVGMETGVRF